MGAVVLPGQASAATYECSFRVSGNKLISRNVKLVHNENTGAVSVSDFFTGRHNGGPVAGEVSVTNATRTTFKWTVQVKNRRQTSASLAFRLTYYKNGNAPIITAQAVGFSNADRASGQCKLS